MKIETFADSIDPDNTIILFGAGASIPSGAPSADELAAELAKNFSISGLSELSDIARSIELKRGRNELEQALKARLQNLKPVKGMKALPSFNWPAIYTTNYDTIVENAYSKNSLKVITSNKDFGKRSPAITTLYKLHGCISQAGSREPGNRLLITKSDLRDALVYRDALWTRFAADILENDVLIIGHSLGDAHLDQLIFKAQEALEGGNSSRRIFLLVYEATRELIELRESEGLVVACGDVDRLISLLASKAEPPEKKSAQSPLQAFVRTLAITDKVSDLQKAQRSNPDRMFMGAPANYADINEGLTFDRSAEDYISKLATSESPLPVIVLGPSGIGKTTLLRRVASKLMSEFDHVWEHIEDYQLSSHDWIEIAKGMNASGEKGLLIINDAHHSIFDLEILSRYLNDSQNASIKILANCTESAWNHQIKSYFNDRTCSFVYIRQLDDIELENLRRLVTTRPEIQRLADKNFKGFSRQEQLKRIRDTFKRDTFVCLKRIFQSNKFDEIILREYNNDLSDEERKIYLTVSALETINFAPHRQLVIRLSNIQPANIPVHLDRLTDIISERDKSTESGIYLWHGRHIEISKIIFKYKIAIEEAVFDFIASTIDLANPTYELEVASLMRLCSPDGGISLLSNLESQATLLRMIISSVPRMKYPRYRLISNLIRSGEFDSAESECRVFSEEFGSNASIYRYRALILLKNTQLASSLTDDDKLIVLAESLTFIEKAINSDNTFKYTHKTHLDIGEQVYKLGGSIDPYIEARTRLIDYAQDFPDSEVQKWLGKMNALDIEFDLV